VDGGTVCRQGMAYLSSLTAFSTVQPKPTTKANKAQAPKMLALGCAFLNPGLYTTSAREVLCFDKPAA